MLEYIIKDNEKGRFIAVCLAGSVGIGECVERHCHLHGHYEVLVHGKLEPAAGAEVGEDGLGLKVFYGCTVIGRQFLSFIAASSSPL